MSASWRGTPFNGKRTFFSTESQGNRLRLYSWKTTCSVGSTPWTGAPWWRTSPASMGRSPAIARRSVVFPQPEGPTRLRNSPSASERETSRMASVSPSRTAKPLRMPSTVITSLAIAETSRAAMVPGQHAPLHVREQDRECPADQSDQQDAAVHLGHEEAALRGQDLEPEPRAGADHLREDHEDQRDAQRGAHSREDLGHARGQRDPPQDRERPEPVDLPR